MDGVTMVGKVVGARGVMVERNRGVVLVEQAVGVVEDTNPIFEWFTNWVHLTVMDLYASLLSLWNNFYFLLKLIVMEASLEMKERLCSFTFMLLYLNIYYSFQVNLHILLIVLSCFFKIFQLLKYFFKHFSVRLKHKQFLI